MKSTCPAARTGLDLHPGLADSGRIWFCFSPFLTPGISTSVVTYPPRRSVQYTVSCFIARLRQMQLWNQEIWIKRTEVVRTEGLGIRRSGISVRPAASGLRQVPRHLYLHSRKIRVILGCRGPELRDRGVRCTSGSEAVQPAGGPLVHSEWWSSPLAAHCTHPESLQKYACPGLTASAPRVLGLGISVDPFRVLAPSIHPSLSFLFPRPSAVLPGGALGVLW